MEFDPQGAPQSAAGLDRYVPFGARRWLQPLPVGSRRQHDAGV